MSALQKSWLCKVIVGISLIAALYGLQNIMATRSLDGLWGAGLLFGGTVAGCAAGVGTRYYRAVSKSEYDANAVAVRTLAKLAQKPTSRTIK